MLKTILKINTNLKYIIKNQTRNNHRKLDGFLSSTQISEPTKKNIEHYILTTQICTIIGSTGGVILYGGDALLKNVEKGLLTHFIETMKGITIGLVYGSWFGFFWPITASVICVRFGHMSLKYHS